MNFLSNNQPACKSFPNSSESSAISNSWEASPSVSGLKISKETKIVILGGAGALAAGKMHNYFLNSFVRSNKIKDDFSYPNILLDNFPLRGISKHGVENYFSLEQEVLQRCQNYSLFGMEIILPACNSMAMLKKPVEEEYPELNFISLPDFVSKELALLFDKQQNQKKLNQLSVLSSSSSDLFQLYDYPKAASNKATTALIQSIICQNKKEIGRLMKKLNNHLLRTKQTNILLGCTELSLVKEYFDPKINLFDSLELAVDFLFRENKKIIVDSKANKNNKGSDPCE